jgi:hypothetical protein
MKKTLVAIVILVMSANVSASDWQWEQYYDVDNLSMYVDKTKIRGVETKKVWEKWEYKKKVALGIASMLSLIEVDCLEVRARTLEMESFSENDLKGKTIASIKEPGQWDYLRPGSWKIGTFEMVCGKKP